MRWNRIEGNFVAIADFDSILDIKEGITQNEWIEFTKYYEQVYGKKPIQFIVSTQFSAEVGEILSLELSNSLRIKVRVLEILKEEENTLLVTTNF